MRRSIQGVSLQQQKAEKEPLGREDPHPHPASHRFPGSAFALGSQIESEEEQDRLASEVGRWSRESLFGEEVMRRENWDQGAPEAERERAKPMKKEMNRWLRRQRRWDGTRMRKGS